MMFIEGFIVFSLFLLVWLYGVFLIRDISRGNKDK